MKPHEYIFRLLLLFIFSVKFWKGAFFELFKNVIDQIVVFKKDWPEFYSAFSVISWNWNFDEKSRMALPFGLFFCSFFHLRSHFVQLLLPIPLTLANFSRERMTFFYTFETSVFFRFCFVDVVYITALPYKRRFKM